VGGQDEQAEECLSLASEVAESSQEEAGGWQQAAEDVLASLAGMEPWPATDDERRRKRRGSWLLVEGGALK
jgi:hypothetical protein